MMPVRIGDATLYLGDVLAVLAGLSDESVHCVVTSPPYWGLRDYGTGTWEGGSAECDHVEKVAQQHLAALADKYDPHPNPRNPNRQDEGPINTRTYREVCGKCGARRIDQQIGLEETPEEYVAKMVAVFRAVRRVLRRDGTAWINLGDSYATKPASSGISFRRDRASVQPTRGLAAGLKEKDLCGIPWRVAFALQADGWYLRSDIIWAKPNPMPESVTDRPTKAHEYLFLLSKSPRYFYDADAVRETTGNEMSREEYESRLGHSFGGEIATRFGIDKHDGGHSHPNGRNRRTVWTIATEPFPGAHFATFPRKLVEPCILAGCPRKVCPDCGAPWVREVEPSPEYAKQLGKGPMYRYKKDGPGGAGITTGAETSNRSVTPEYRTIGEHPTCDHGLPPVPGTVLEPFCGSGTTLVVVLTHGRRGIGIELKPEYFDMACNRLRHGTVDPEEVREAETQFALFDAGAQGSHE